MASSSRPKVNLRSTAVKRIMQEAAELSEANVDEDGFVAAPLESDIFEWHCTIRGVQDSEYESGLYHLRILLPPSYPMSAPDIMLMTPNGRFELGKKICIDGLTSFHAGSWQPAWGVRTAVVGLRSFWMQSGEALSAIGALDYSKEERRRLARLSKDWKCPICGVRNEEILSVRGSTGSSAVSQEEKGRDTDSMGISGEDGSAEKDEEGERRDEQTHTASREEEAQPDESPNTESSDAAISIDPSPAEIPIIIPPISALNTTSATLAQPLPVEIIPPTLEELPQSESHPSSQATQSPSSDTPAPISSQRPSEAPAQLPTRTATVPPPRPPPTISRWSFRSPPVTPPPIETQAFSSRRVVPIWLDAIIIAAISILILLISRKFA
ncbi:hypothetical protein CI109_103552 [Kwoniella shandongensis]|uniref:UBC core domain-containing protein n=1 Tax=Kwoniella shandongensis TaxID=1734106 RepID=A0A5M6BXG4_9TREE|nr:uncharacterized protein CI109_004546 [Kwoniella shandongensis]KAA5527011.1 hypothetical protein CI109_004546 [Kwoniella shandongensis]